MKTLTLDEAAEFLKMHPEEVRSRAKRGLIPGAKTGKRWVFIDADLAEYIRSLYAHKRQALRVDHDKETSCHSAKEEVSGGSILRPHQEEEYDALLKQKTSKKPKSYTTS